MQNAQAYRQGIGKVGEVINQAVITIPAYFNDKQRHATRTAALKAGLTPLELLPEPTSAAISYGFSPSNEDVKTILVYDFGGGTFDASLITATGNQFNEPPRRKRTGYQNQKRANAHLYPTSDSPCPGL